MKEILRLSQEINKQEELNACETSMKLNRVIPFLRALGYDDSNPKEFMAEVCIDTGGRLPKRVDFACGKSGKMHIFIEAKRAKRNLNKDIEQLAEYFNLNDDVYLGILTNGEEYLFFREDEDTNLMDENYFYKINIRNISKDDQTFLRKIKKNKINKDVINNLEKDSYLREVEMLNKMLIWSKT